MTTVDNDLYIYEYSMKFGVESDFYYNTSVIGRYNKDKKIFKKMRALYKIKHKIELLEENENIQITITILPYFLKNRLSPIRAYDHAYL